MRMNRTEDATEYLAAFRATPLAPRLDGLTREAAGRTPGACVKSTERESATGWPKHHGKLAVFDEAGDRVIVRSHEDGITEPRCVWTGTVAEFLADWIAD